MMRNVWLVALLVLGCGDGGSLPADGGPPTIDGGAATDGGSSAFETIVRTNCTPDGNGSRSRS
jgi:hypothetical protein